MSELTNNLNTRDPLRLTVTILLIINATPTKENGFQDGRIHFMKEAFLANLHWNYYPQGSLGHVAI